jgi:hypothetical protein
MDDGARVKLIEIADTQARYGLQTNQADVAKFLVRFRTYYHHLAATVDHPGPVMTGHHDYLASTDKDLEALK